MTIDHTLRRRLRSSDFEIESKAYEHIHRVYEIEHPLWIDFNIDDIPVRVHLDGHSARLTEAPPDNGGRMG